MQFPLKYILFNIFTVEFIKKKKIFSTLKHILEIISIGMKIPKYVACLTDMKIYCNIHIY